MSRQVTPTTHTSALVVTALLVVGLGGCLLEWDRSWAPDASGAPDQRSSDALVPGEQVQDLLALDAAQSKGWAVSLGAKRGQAWDVALDKASNLYVTGYFTSELRAGSTATFGAAILTSKGGYDVFVTRAQADGATFQWARSAGSVKQDEARDLVVNSSDQVFLAGFHGGNMVFGTPAVSHSNETDLFVTRLSAGGTFAWAVSSSGAGSEVAEAMALGPSGDLIDHRFHHQRGQTGWRGHPLQGRS